MSRNAWKLLPVLATLLLSAIAMADTMSEEIDYILTTVRDSDCTFIRNGKRYVADAAVDHLQMKRKHGKRYFDTADEFIENLASKSSMSGKPYFIQCGDEAQQPSGEWFAAILAKHREK